jgi:predicted transcriptional regulator YdeE
MTIQPVRFDTHRPMLVAGLRRKHLLGHSHVSVPEQWREFKRMKGLARVDLTVTYGVICAGSSTEIDYLSGAEVPSFEGLDPAIGRVRIAEQRYAVFLHQGPVSGIAQTWRAILDDWLPRSGETSANAPDFEVYDRRFDGDRGIGPVEIWFPIARPGSRP